MLPDSTAIDQALVGLLLADPALHALMPDGVFWAEGNPGAKRFVIVSLVDAQDVPVFGSTAYEDAVYSIDARALSTSGGDVQAAAARIHELLQDRPFVVAGYGWMSSFREGRHRVTEVDALDPTIRWQRRGGTYRVQFAVRPEVVLSASSRHV